MTGAAAENPPKKPGFFARIFGQKTPEAFLALDLGTEVIKALVVRPTPDGRGEVLGSGRAEQRLGDMHAGAVTDILGVSRNAFLAASEAVAEARIRPKKVALGIAGELVKGATRTVVYERDEPGAPIAMPELKNIVHKVQWEAFHAAREEIAREAGVAAVETKLVNSAIVEVRIDGQRVVCPIDFRGREVLLSIFNSFAPIVHLSALEAVAKHLGLEILTLTTEPYAVSRALGHEDGGEFSAIFIDIGGGTTDVAVVRDGVTLGTRMFAFGGRLFTKRISDEMGLAWREAEAVKRAYAAGELDRDSAARVRSLVAADAEIWRAGVELALGDFSDQPLPHQILLCGGGSLLPDLPRVLAKKDWLKNTAFAREPRIRLLGPADVANLADRMGRLASAQDVTPLALGNLALDAAAAAGGPIDEILAKMSRVVGAGV